MNTAIVRASVVLCLFAVGCASPTLRDRAAIPQHEWFDADWYSQAIEESVDAYEADVARATSIRYRSMAEAEAVAATFENRGFDAHLAASLHSYGLTLRGLRVYESNHRGFLDSQAELFRPRIGRAQHELEQLTEARVANIALTAFDTPDGPPTQIATR